MEDIKQVGKYKIESIIGKGGMGVVYKAVDSVIKRNVAIKMMTQSSFDQETAKKRFFREAQAIGQLQHPNIITIYDVGEYENMPYLVVEFLDGKDLKTLLREGLKLNTIDIISMLIDVSDALEYSHKNGIIHRDIKPANIFILNNKSVKLMDFGVAKMEDVDLTQTGTILGTIHYMSPEQVKGKGVDHRSDLFSLGVVMYELFSQRRPFEGDSFTGILSKILFSEPEPFQPLDNELPPVLNSIISKALAKDQNERYQSASELQLDLTKIKIFYSQASVSAQLNQKSTIISPTEIVQKPPERKERVQPAAKRKTERGRERPKVSPPKSKVKPVVYKPARKMSFARGLFYIMLIAFIGTGVYVLYLNKDHLFHRGVTDRATSTDSTMLESEADSAVTDTPATEYSKSEVDNKDTTPTKMPEDHKTLSAKDSDGKRYAENQSETEQKDSEAALASAHYNQHITQARRDVETKNWMSVEQNANQALRYQPHSTEAQSLVELARDNIKNQNIADFLEMGKKAWQEKDYQRTIDSMNKVLALAPNHQEAQDYKTRAEKKLSPESATTTQPPSDDSSLELLKLQGQHAYDKGDYAECIDIMNQILAVDSRNTFALNLKARSREQMSGSGGITVSVTSQVKQMKQAFEKGDYDTSIQLANNVLTVDPMNKEAQTIRSQAQQQVAAASEQKQRNNDIALARKYLNAGDIVKARAIADQLVNQYPDIDDVKVLIKDVETFEKKQEKIIQPTPITEITIKHQPNDKVIVKSKLEITMAYFGYQGRTKVYLVFRSTSKSGWKRARMKERKIYYEATISGREVKLPRMEYFFEIFDDDENLLFSNKDNPYSVKVLEESPGTIVVF